jgi:clan AA aspartic protease
MGTVYEDIILKNAGDVSNVWRGIMPEKHVRTAAVTALVDTGARTIVLSEEIRQKLGLAIEGLRRTTLADGTRAVYPVTEPVRIQWHDRFCFCEALVVPHADTILLGAIPLKYMDLIADPKRQKRIGAHGDQVVCLLR